MLSRIIRILLPSEVHEPLKSIRFILKRPYYRVAAKRRFSAAERSSCPIMIEIGSGPKKGVNGWLTIDIKKECDILWDLRWPLPLPDESVSVIYSSHVLEHFSHKSLLKLMGECKRVLKTNGVFSVCVPNARLYIEGYVRSRLLDTRYFSYRQAVTGTTNINYLNYIAYMDGNHRFMFDEDGLLEILRMAGFRSVRIREFQEGLDLEERKYESLYAICEK